MRLLPLLALAACNLSSPSSTPAPADVEPPAEVNAPAEVETPSEVEAPVQATESAASAGTEDPPSNAACKPFDPKALGSVLLTADLNDDGADDHVIELADSCGTGGCTTQVFLACEGGARMVADIPQWTGVQLGSETHGGLRDLITQVKRDHKPVDVVLQWGEGGYRAR